MTGNRQELYGKISTIVENEFSDIVVGIKNMHDKLRFVLVDDSYIDIWFSEYRPGIYSYHWERKMVDGTIYRHNNLPDRESKKLKTFPKHYHEGSKRNIKESYISDNPEEAIREFLGFARLKIKEKNEGGFER